MTKKNPLPAPPTRKVEPGATDKVTPTKSEVPATRKPPQRRPNSADVELLKGAAKYTFPANDKERAARFVQQFKDELRYVRPWKHWMSWDGTRWVPHGEFERAFEMVDLFQTEAATETHTKAANIFGNEFAIKAMINLSRHQESVVCEPTHFDSDPMLLGLSNGTLELRTGTRRDAGPQDHISKRANVTYDAAATCPQWERFIARVFNDDAELIALVRRAVGYSLTGLTTEQILFFAYGTGQNGKSTFFDVLLHLFGDYGQKTKSELFTQNRWSKEPEGLIAQLVGARFVVGAEIQAAARLNEALVKDLCGGDLLVGKRLYENPFSFRPLHKIWGYGNYCPTVHDTDKGIWRRLRVIPFNVEIPDAERDRELVEKLKAESAGILNWAISGCLEWQRQGLGTAAAATEATEDYRDEEDEIGEYIAEKCTLEGRITRRQLYTDFREWAEIEQGTPPGRILSKTLFSRRLRTRAGISDYKPKIDGERAWDGITIRPS
jgi:putative DNA primase/helicase